MKYKEERDRVVTEIWKHWRQFEIFIVKFGRMSWKEKSEGLSGNVESLFKVSILSTLMGDFCLLALHWLGIITN